MEPSKKIIEETAVVSFSDLPSHWERSWTELVELRGLNPTLLPGWIRVVLDSWEIEADRIQVFVQENNEHLMGVIPYILESKQTLGLPLKVLSLASNLVSYHAEIVCKSDVKDLLQPFFEKAPKWDKLYVQNVIDDGFTAVAIRKLCAERGWRYLESQVDISPYLPLEGSFQQLIASKDRKFRYKYRKRHEHLVASEQLRIKWYRERDHVEAFLRAFVEVESNSWKAQSGVDVSDANREGRYYAQLLPFLSSKRALLANVLWHGEKPIAYSLCCHWGGWVGHLKTGFDTRFESLSAGALVIDACLEAAFEAGAREFDFLGTPGKRQAEPHKLHWTKNVRRHVSFEVFSRRLIPRFIGLLKQTKDRFALQRQ